MSQENEKIIKFDLYFWIRGLLGGIAAFLINLHFKNVTGHGMAWYAISITLIVCFAVIDVFWWMMKNRKKK